MKKLMEDLLPLEEFERREFTRKGRKPALSFMRPFGYLVTILNTIDHLGKFNGKADEGFFVGYSTNSKAFRVFNSRTRIVEENLHVQFSENTPNIAGSRPNWLFDIDALTKSMNYKPVVVGNQSNSNTGAKACNDAGEKEKNDAEDPENKDSEVPSTEEPRKDQRVNQVLDTSINSTNNINTASDGNCTNNVNVVTSTVNAAITDANAVNPKTSIKLLNDPNMPEFEDIVYSNDAEDVGAEANMNNLDIFMHFKLQQVWTLMDLPNGKRAIGTKWVYKNKKDERVAIIEAIRLFLDYTSFKDFVVYQMDVKSAFLYGKIKEEVYVRQPLGFEDPDFPDRVYKVEKALYGLHQAPRAWYETLSTYLLDNGFLRGKIDKTLFIRRDKGDILLVQVYVDDIIFGSTKKSLCTEFEKMMHKKFQMSSMGELTFFLGLQVKQKEDGIFIS
ncbi:putative ribonuclease H-like domain-containing protein [Tanacetum coccineum]